MMRALRIAVALALAAPGLGLQAQESKTFVGYITDTMCTTDHSGMHSDSDPKCVKDCVGDGKTYQYALAVGKNVYKLSDQETPAKFAGRKVSVKGTLYAKTGILKVESITAAE